jgi:quercetin dioxygenase-like cupin family protein
MNGYFVNKDAGEAYDMGVISMRVLVDDQADGVFGLVEFRGKEGPWTIPHRHDHTTESFYVLQGSFDFVCGDRTETAGPGDYILIPVGSPHMITAHDGGGALLSIFAPAGLQEMFKALSKLPEGSLRDPAARHEIAKKFDSIPV